MVKNYASITIRGKEKSQGAQREALLKGLFMVNLLILSQTQNIYINSQNIPSAVKFTVSNYFLGIGLSCVFFNLLK